jgi:peptidoglycan/LPS O-acetylase OafA/YrhL
VRSTLIVSFFVAGAVVTLVQLVRVREPKLLAILAVFLCLGLAHTYEYWEAWFQRFHLLAGAAALVLVFLVSPRHHPQGHLKK